MKLQTLFTTALLLTLLLFVGSNSAIAQASRQQMTQLISIMPSEASIAKMSPENEQVIRESMAVMKKMASLKENQYLAAQELWEKLVKILEEYFLTPYQRCIRGCTRAYAACVAACDNATCRSQCYYSYLDCTRGCGRRAKGGELPGPSKLDTGGQK